MTAAMNGVAAAVLDALRERAMTLSVAESLTGGALSAALVAVPGASDVLSGAVVAYATPLKASVLGVDPVLLSSRGPVDPEVARQMAMGVRTALAVEGRRADVGIATTGVAGPAVQSGQPVGTVHVGVSIEERTFSRAFRFEGDRAAIRAATVGAALALVLQTVEGTDSVGIRPGGHDRE